MSWQLDAACRNTDPALVFGSHGNSVLKPLCAACPVRVVCLWSAMLEEYDEGAAAHHRRFYMRGGMTAWDRGELTLRLTRYEIRRRYLQAIDGYQYQRAG